MLKRLPSSLAMDESNDVCDIAQFLIFIRDIDHNFVITEELAAVHSLKGTTKSEDLFQKVCDSVKNETGLGQIKKCDL